MSRSADRDTSYGGLRGVPLLVGYSFYRVISMQSLFSRSRLVPRQEMRSHRWEVLSNFRRVYGQDPGNCPSHRLTTKQSEVVERFIAFCVELNAYPSSAMHFVTSFPFRIDLWYQWSAGLVNRWFVHKLPVDEEVKIRLIWGGRGGAKLFLLTYQPKARRQYGSSS